MEERPRQQLLILSLRTERQLGAAPAARTPSAPQSAVDRPPLRCVSFCLHSAQALYVVSMIFEVFSRCFPGFLDVLYTCSACFLLMFSRCSSDVLRIFLYIVHFGIDYYVFLVWCLSGVFQVSPMCSTSCLLFVFQMFSCLSGSVHVFSMHSTFLLLFSTCSPGVLCVLMVFSRCVLYHVLYIFSPVLPMCSRCSLLTSACKFSTAEM